MENKGVSKTSSQEKSRFLIQFDSVSFTGRKIHSYTIARTLHEREQTISNGVEKRIALWSL